MELQSLTQEVSALAREVGRYLREERSRITADAIEVKGQGDFVSHADRHAEELLKAGLTALLPGSVVMAEEMSPDARGGEWRWIVDPLDGTSNYLQGLPVYAVSIALEDRRNDPEAFGPRVLGVVYVPGLDVLFEAFRGGGARRNGQPIRVRSNDDLKRAVIATAFPFRERTMLDGYISLFRELYPKIADFRRIGAAAVDLCWVADATFDGYFEMDLKPWDLAAGGVILEEAGGRITDWWGGDELESGWVVCGTPSTCQALRAAIDRVGFTPPEERWK